LWPRFLRVVLHALVPSALTLPSIRSTRRPVRKLQSPTAAPFTAIFFLFCGGPARSTLVDALRHGRTVLSDLALQMPQLLLVPLGEDPPRVAVRVYV
jgi:hypothetical protein